MKIHFAPRLKQGGQSFFETETDCDCRHQRDVHSTRLNRHSCSCGWRLQEPSKGSSNMDMYIPHRASVLHQAMKDLNATFYHNHKAAIVEKVDMVDVVQNSDSP